MSENGCKLAPFTPKETEFYRIRVFVTRRGDGRVLKCIRLDPKPPNNPTPQFYTRTMAMNVIEALQTGIAMADVLRGEEYDPGSAGEVGHVTVQSLDLDGRPIHPR